MPLYHLNPQTGEPGVCRATLACPFGDLDHDHYDSKDEARAAYEEKNGTALFKERSAKAKPNAAPYPKYLTPELIASIPPAQDGSTFEENWEKEFGILGHEKYRTIESTLLNAMGNPNFGRPRSGLYLQRMDPASFDPYEENPTHPNYEMGMWPHDAPEAQQFDLVAAIHTRNGGGNRECWCNDESHADGPCTALITEELENRPDFIRSWDNEFDGTYADFVFAVEDTDELRQAMKEDGLARKQASMKASFDAIKRREWSPLMVMPKNPTTEKKLKEAETKLRAIEAKRRTALNAVRAHEKVRLNFGKHTKAAFEKVLAKDPMKWTAKDEEVYKSVAGIQDYSLARTLSDVRKYGKDAALYAKMDDEITAGQASPTAVEILGGAKKVKENRRYQERLLARAMEPLDRVRKHHEASERHEKKHSEIQAEVKKYSAALHWPGPWHRMPDALKAKGE